MPRYQLTITAESEVDIGARTFGISIDEPLRPDFYATQPEKIIGTFYRKGTKTITIDLPSGEHRIYIGSNAPDTAPWDVTFSIPDLISGTASVSIGSSFEGKVIVPTTTEALATMGLTPELVKMLEQMRGMPIEQIIPEVAEVPTVTIQPTVTVTPAPPKPTLPWYVSWLQPVLDYGGALTESVVNFFAPIFAPLGDIADNITEFLKDPLKGTIEGLSTLFRVATDNSIQTITQRTKEIAEGSPEWHKELNKSLVPIEQAIVSGYQEAIDITTYEKSPLVGEDAVKALGDMRDKLVATALLNFVFHAAAEACSLGQYEALSQIEPMVASKFGFDALINRATMLPIEKAILIPAEHEYNTRYTPEIPTYTDLINMVVKEVISIDDFRKAMAKQGFSTTWSDRIWDAHFYPPNYTQILTAYFRGVITKDEMEKMRILVDLDPRYKAVWDANVEVIPPYAELTNELVKEVIDLPTYEKYLQWHGYDKTWAKRIWDAHFIPPSLGDILTAWRRGLITEADVDRLMILVDLDPRFKNVFDTRKYVDPSLSLTRFMFETGALSADEVPEYVHRQGYSPEHEKAIADYILRFQERLWRRRYLVALSAAVSLGAVAPDMLKKEVLDAGYTEGVADWMLKASEMRTKITEYKVEHPKPKLLSVSDLEKAYILDKIDTDTLRIELLQRGYLADEVDLKINLMTEDKIIAEEGRKVVALSIPQLLDAFRYGEIVESDLITRLQLRGLSLDETMTLVNTKKKQWGLGE